MAEKLLLEDWSFQDEVSLGEIYDVESKFIKTEPELQEFHSSLTTLEEKQLEENLQKVGCINPLIVWKRDMHGFVLIDGHYRFKICKQNNIGFKVREIKLTSIDQAKAFMLEEQLGRRNLTIEQLQYYRGLKYAGLTKIKGYGKLQNQGGDDEVKRACELLAKRYNVSKNTIIRDAEFAKGLNVLGGANPELKNEVLSGSKKIAKKDIQQLAKMPNGEFLGKVNTINDVLLKINSFKSNQDKIFQERALKKKLEREREIREYKLNIDEVFQSDEQRLNSLKARVLSSMKEAIEEDKIVAVRMGIKYLKEMELIIKNRKEKSKKK